MDMRFLVTRPPLLFMHNLLSDSARVTHAFCWLADTTLASLQGLISESLKPKNTRSWVSLQIIENMVHLLLKPVVSLSARHQGISHLVFEGHALRVVAHTA